MLLIGWFACIALLILALALHNLWIYYLWAVVLCLLTLVTATRIEELAELADRYRKRGS